MTPYPPKAARSVLAEYFSKDKENRPLRKAYSLIQGFIEKYGDGRHIWFHQLFDTLDMLSIKMPLPVVEVNRAFDSSS